MNMLVHDLSLSRRACDRCHGQKLRCPRENNSTGCLRCERAGVRCTPRPVRSRPRARSNANTQHQGTQETTNQMNQEFSDYFNLSPMGLLDMPTDLDMGLESTSLDAEIDHSYVHSGADLGHNHQQDTQTQSSPISAGQSEQARPNTALNPSGEASEGLYDFTSFAPRISSRYISNYSRHRISLARDTSPIQDIDQPGQDDAMMDFDQDGDANANANGKDTGTDPGYHTQSCSSQQDQNQEDTLDPNAEIHHPVATSWIHRLSDMNMQLHQHMVSIPTVETGQGGQGNSDGDSPTSTKADRLPVDHTFKLSYQYMELLGSIFSQVKARRYGNVPPKDTDLTLDQPSQLLVLSSYLCLVESYNMILQHIKAWIETRLKMGRSSSTSTSTSTSASEPDVDARNLDHPIKLPSLTIGSFPLPHSSSSAPLVLTCIVETTMMHMHALVSEGMSLASSTDGSFKETVNSAPRAERRTSGVGGGELSSVAKVTLQAIEAHEDSTLQLIHVVWKMALRCAML